jgi:hypothetical protein
LERERRDAINAIHEGQMGLKCSEGSKTSQEEISPLDLGSSLFAPAGQLSEPQPEKMRKRRRVTTPPRVQV